MKDSYYLEQKPFASLIGYFIGIGVLLAIIGAVAAVAESSGSLFYGIAILAGLGVLAMYFVPTTHAANLLGEIPEIEKHEQKDAITEQYKAKHPLFIPILLINLSPFILLGHAYFTDGIYLSDESLFSLFLVPWLVAHFLAHKSVQIKISSELVEAIGIELKTS